MAYISRGKALEFVTQPKVKILTNYDVQESLMLHTKFCRNRSTGSGKNRRFFMIYMYKQPGNPGHVTQMPQTNICSPYPRRLNTKFGFDWPSCFGDYV